MKGYIVNYPSRDPSGNFLIAAVAVVSCFIIAACAAIYIAVPEGANTGSIIVIIFGSLAPTVAALLSIRSGTQARVQAKSNGDKLDKVLNGEMDTKLDRANDRAADKLVERAVGELAKVRSPRRDDEVK